MKVFQTLRRVAVLGTKWEAADIVDYIEQLAIVLGLAEAPAQQRIKAVLPEPYPCGGLR
jgi:hypothetical protein